jgi:hypothetical protein
MNLEQTKENRSVYTSNPQKLCALAQTSGIQLFQQSLKDTPPPDTVALICQALSNLSQSSPFTLRHL